MSARATWAVCTTCAMLVRAAGAADVAVEVRDLQGNALPDAVVFVEESVRRTAPVVAPSRAEIDQVDKQFVPRVTVLRAGTEVSFPNSDNIRHSVYSFSPAKVFTTKLYAGRQAPPVLFDKTGVVALGCNIHDQMLAWVVIVDTPWYGKTAGDGTVRLKGLPSGAHRVSTWYPGLTQPRAEDIHVPETGAHLQVRIDTSDSPQARKSS